MNVNVTDPGTTDNFCNGNERQNFDQHSATTPCGCVFRSSIISAILDTLPKQQLRRLMKGCIDDFAEMEEPAHSRSVSTEMIDP